MIRSLTHRKIVNAKLVGWRTANGFWCIDVDRATIGKVYEVDLNTVKTNQWFNLPTETHFDCETVDALQDDGEWHPFPTELLEFQR